MYIVRKLEIFKSIYSARNIKFASEFSTKMYRTYYDYVTNKHLKLINIAPTEDLETSDF